MDPGEECDLGAGNSDNAGCTSTCSLARCGDGLLYIGVEACDDGNDVEDDGCNSSCAIPSCGDGVVDPGEECDLGQDNADNGACTSLCKNATCGDGLMGPGEACDGGAGCSSDCTLAGCGNGVLDPGEACDPMLDGFENCDLDCTFAECGDGTLNPEAGESCDDGNTDPGDGCHSDCTTYKIAFVTKLAFPSVLGGQFANGVLSLDALCQSTASAAGLPGQFRAWASTQEEDVIDRLNGSPIPIRLVDGTLVAPSGGALVGNNQGLANPIALTSKGEAPNATDDAICGGTVNVAVWTATKTTGEFAPGAAGTAGDCGSWTDGGGIVAIGDATAKNARWTTACTAECDTTKAHFYCFMQ